MKFSKIWSTVLATALAVLGPSVIHAEPADDYLSAWEQIKRLSGTWDSYIVGEEGRGHPGIGDGRGVVSGGGRARGVDCRQRR